jgi:hypothetical protein
MNDRRPAMIFEESGRERKGVCDVDRWRRAAK